MARCWIMSSRRWGDTDEVVWEVTWWGTPPKDEFGENIIDLAPEYVKWFKTQAAARKYAQKAARSPDNYWQLCQIQKMTLDRIEGTTWDWDGTGAVEEVAAG